MLYTVIPVLFLSVSDSVTIADVAEPKLLWQPTSLLSEYMTARIAA